MKNKNYYPFDRNHYYYGKLLTVRDFEVEQRYNNKKRRILNKLLVGAGVLAGLDVLLLDDQRISIESGMAIDDFGREIVVHEPVMKRLKLIDGFEQVKDANNVYLCIEYDEEFTEPVHSIVSTPTQEAEGSQFNRITESYRLYLTDQPLAPDALMKYKLEKEKQILFQNQFLTIEQIVPRYVEQNKSLEVEINIYKKGSIDPVEISFTLETGHLKDEFGNQKIEVLFQEKENSKEWKLQRKYKLSADNVKKTVDQVKVAKDNFTIKIGQQAFAIDNDLHFKVQVIDDPIHERLRNDYYNIDFDDLISTNSNDAIYIAKLNLITSGDLYIIESLEKMPFQQYVMNSNLLQMMIQHTENDCQGTMQDSELDNGKNALIQEIMDRQIDPSKWFATGVEEVNLGLERTKNKRYFSDEIAHGLGNGSVAIVLAVEDTKQYLENSGERVMLFGDNSIFKTSHFDTELPEYRIAALAYPDKGTFRIGVHLLEQGKILTLKVRWWAYKHVGEEYKEDGIWAEKNINIIITPNTITVAPREKVHFTATIEGTNNKECRWQVKEMNGGEIDYNGVYKAPNSEGIYEVIAQSVKYPQKKASAFVVVKGYS
jgi:hypothetical protein